MSEYDAIIQDLQRSVEALTAERDRLRKLCEDIYGLANHAVCFDNFKMLKDHLGSYTDAVKNG